MSLLLDSMHLSIQEFAKIVSKTYTFQIYTQILWMILIKLNNLFIIKEINNLTKKESTKPNF